MEKKQYQKGHFVGMGLAIGIPIGIPLGLAIGNIALGPALGLPIGLVIGFMLERKYNPNPIELSEKEVKKRKRVLRATLISGLTLLILVLWVILHRP
jgi:di/tricarboxylate transporter